MSQENEFNESEVIEEEILEDEIEDNEEDLGEDDGESEDKDETIARLKQKIGKMTTAIVKNKQKSKKSKSAPKQAKTSGYDSQVDLLRFNGVTSDEIEKLKQIATLEGVDLIDARNSDYFKMYKEKTEQEAKSKQASLSSSNRGKPTANSLERSAKRVATSDKFSKDDVKALIHGK